MNFFARQERARGASRRLVLLFVLATLAIVLAVNAVVLLLVVPPANGAFDAAWLRGNLDAILLTSLLVVAFIGGTSLFRMASLGAGGGEVAKALGGSLVAPDTRDPARRRLLNVVEEMAIASGVPVPEVYVMEEEAGINAFAAGHSPADAAVAVTRGALDRLTRDELQGVIAHEFSHILNGDMRLNLRLMGAQFGILAIALLGRVLLRSTRHFRGGRSREAGAAIGGLALAGLAFILIGYIGVLFARIIQAAVSRKREYLADASAVQFTRLPDGIAGALKKIAGYGEGSRIVGADPTEVGHMLFASGFRGLSLASVFATHPPVEKRIQALDPSFDPAQLKAMTPPQAVFEGPDETPVAGFAPAAAFPIEPEIVAGAAGSLDEPAIAAAHRLHAAIPPALIEAAHAQSQTGPLILALLLGEGEVGQRQLAHIETLRGAGEAAVTAALHEEIVALNPAFRLPLAEIAFPALRLLPRARQQELIRLANELAAEDNLTSLFEYALSRLLAAQLEEAAAPAGGLRAKVVFDNSVEALQVLFSVLAVAGHEDPDDARRAYAAGITRLLPGSPPPYDPPRLAGTGWSRPLDRALARLDGLSWTLKERLVEALAVTLRHDGRVTLEEAELLRAICASLHCPLPIFHAALVE